MGICQGIPFACELKEQHCNPILTSLTKGSHLYTQTAHGCCMVRKDQCGVPFYPKKFEYDVTTY